MKYLSKFYFSGFSGISVFIVSTFVTLWISLSPLLDGGEDYKETGYWVMFTFAHLIYWLFQIRNYIMVKNNTRIQKEMREKGFSEEMIRDAILHS